MDLLLGDVRSTTPIHSPAEASERPPKTVPHPPPAPEPVSAGRPTPPIALRSRPIERHSGQSLHPESPQVRQRSPQDDDERAENGSFRLLRIALAMTSAWSRSTPPAANCWATASVSNMRAAYQPATGETAPAVWSIPVDFKAKPIQPDRRFSRSGPGNTGLFRLTECLVIRSTSPLRPCAAVP